MLRLGATGAAGITSVALPAASATASGSSSVAGAAAGSGSDGGGGGGGNPRAVGPSFGGAGGSGIVIVRYPIAV